MSSSSESVDVVICGGGVIGSSVAYHLAADPGFTGKVVVVEKDPTYRLAASALSAASIRQQYSSAVNIRISLHGIAFLRNIGTHLAVDEDVPVIDLHEGGYLYLASEEGAPVLAANQKLQVAEGADVALYAAEMLRSKFSWLNTSDITCGTLGISGEGWFDGWAVLQAFRKKARSLGVEYRQGEVARYIVEGGRVAAVELADGSRIACGAAVNASGTHGARLAATAGVAIPVRSMKRYVFSFTCKGAVDNCPLLIDTSGVWCRPEGKRGSDGQLFIGSCYPLSAEQDQEWIETDPSVEDVDWAFFEETVWPTLAHRIPAFEEIRPGRAWAGPYDMNELDHNAIIGPAVGAPNLHLANGFSGHGLQQAPAVGRGLAEHILHGAYRTLDLADLGHERIVARRPLLETNVI
ncbi:NAD(P)/FAD-dependent oxidoreductase [Bosea sp. PAMC 26642]|uniref:NAD(P)/FAD-dependent oxidoreductase n=1 Tax=Bosea sp. (strain PAMC 26642) TaxID=1792307 RepID=UPI0007703106|nr:FAD-binding oxidoreductase [Bosea sp. PAMC 26642]AMJ63158.1 FAD-dependent oxidoreductase [Bosea sp. PAMC 26642]